MIFNDNQMSLLNIDPLENATLETLLNKNLTVKQLLAIKNIQPKIRSGFSYFIKYCQRNQNFSNQLIDLGIKSPFIQTFDADKKQSCYIAADALTCDQDIVADLLILPDKSRPRKTSSGSQSEGLEQIEENIETETQNSAPSQETELIDQSLSEQQKFSKRYKFLQRVMNYILENDTKQLNENCINYMVKTLNCLIRKKADEFLEYLDKRSEYLKKLIQLNNFSSISQFLIKIISDEDIHYDNVRKIKEIIINGVLSKLKEAVGDEDFIERLDFLDELFQTNKYASEDDRTELQKLSDIFSSKDTIEYFYIRLQHPQSPTEFYNAICYLSIITKRMNIDQEVDPYSYSNEPKDETMVFQMDTLFKQFPSILKHGYNNIIQHQFADIYKQKMVETRFYDLLVLLTKNSRFSNSQQDIKHSVSQLLKGNNIIFENKQEKCQTLKELIIQFFTQAKSGINRIGIIALLEKVIAVQIYQQENHQLQQSQAAVQKQEQPSNNNKDIQQKQTVVVQQQANKVDSKDTDKNMQQDSSSNQTQDKKKRINQFKTKLKLDIKKFTNQHTETIEKQQEKAEVGSKKVQEETNVKRLEASLKKGEIVKMLEFLSEQLKSSTEFGKIMSRKKLKNNDTEITALVNKIVMLLCNAIVWQGVEEELVKQKDEFINQVQSFLTFFNFQEICRNYSTTLATSKHPNATAKQKTNPELNFIADFVKNYSKRRQQPVEKSKESATKNLELSDSEFKSDDDDQDDGQAVKCSIEDFKKLTGFKFQTDKIATNKQQPIATDRSSTEVKNEINILLEENNQEKVEESIEEKIIVQQSKVQENKEETVTSAETKKQEETILKQVEKPIQRSEKVSPNSSKDTTSLIKVPQGPKVPPLQFYVRHRVIFV